MSGRPFANFISTVCEVGVVEGSAQGPRKDPTRYWRERQDSVLRQCRQNRGRDSVAHVFAQQVLRHPSRASTLLDAGGPGESKTRRILL